MIPILIVGIGIANYDITGRSPAKPNLKPNATRNETVLKPSLNPVVNGPKSELHDGKEILSAKLQRMTDLMERFPANHSNSFWIHVDLNKVEFQIDDGSLDILNETIVINNEAKIADILMAFIEHGHTHREQQGSRIDSRSGGPPPPPPKFRIRVETLPEGHTIPERPVEQKKSLSTLNCGVNTGVFSRFQQKHIINPGETDPSQFSALAYLFTIMNRISDAFTNFSWFFVKDPSTLTFVYDDKTDNCTAEQNVPMVTCSRWQKSDHIAACTFSGLCKPSYVSANGHMNPPICQVRPEGNLPDYRIGFEQIRALQDTFVQGVITAPPLEFDWEMSAWRAARWSGNNEVERPTGTPTPREKLLAEYIEAVKNGLLDSVPEEVQRAYFAQPQLVVTRLRRGPRRGVLLLRNEFFTVNPRFVREYDIRGIQRAPGSTPSPVFVPDDFPELGARPTRPPPTEAEASNVPEVHQMTSERAAEIIRTFFNQENDEQVVPTVDELNQLFGPININ